MAVADDALFHTTLSDVHSHAYFPLSHDRLHEVPSRNCVGMIGWPGCTAMQEDWNVPCVKIYWSVSCSVECYLGTHLSYCTKGDHRHRLLPLFFLLCYALIWGVCAQIAVFYLGVGFINSRRALTAENDQKANRRPMSIMS